MRGNFSESSEIQTFFPPKNRWSPKKKKKVFTEIETDFSAKIGNSCRKSGNSCRKFMSKISGRITTCTSQLRHPISFGGAVFNFSPKIGLKSTKNVRFCILHKPMRGLEPPPPPAPPGYATVCKYSASTQLLKIRLCWLVFKFASLFLFRHLNY